MAVKPRTKLNREEPVTGFDVTAVIGRVEFDQNGDQTPHQAAFRLIADWDHPGEYTFPLSDGRTARITVEYEGVTDADQFPNHRESFA